MQELQSMVRVGAYNPIQSRYNIKKSIRSLPLAL